MPPHQWATTPVFLLGTAGLRSLGAAQQEALLAGCRRVLAASRFRFEDPWVRTISGVDEGVFGWVALNYLSGALRCACCACCAHAALCMLRCAVLLCAVLAADSTDPALTARCIRRHAGRRGRRHAGLS